MREIKFRLYCQMAEGLRKYAVTSIEYLRNGQREISKIYIGDSAIDGRYLKDGLAHLVQYTGLKDKNGVEVYEGDIVNCYHANNSLVCMKVQTFGLSTNGIGFVPFYEVYGQCEIIGNIYENPELLEESQNGTK